MLDNVTSFIRNVPDKPFLMFYSEYILDTLDNLVDVEVSRLFSVSDMNKIEVAVNSLVEEVNTIC